VIEVSDPILIESGFEYPDRDNAGRPDVSVGFDDEGALATFTGQKNSLLFARRLTPEGELVGGILQLDTAAEYE